MIDPIAVLQWTAFILALVIAISSIDDLFVDGVFWTGKAYKKLRKPGKQAISIEDLHQKAEQHLAIMVPAWQEHDVIGTMIENAFRTISYDNYVIFVGTYANDPDTIAEVDKLTNRFLRLRHVRLPQSGPTCKADCLNHIVADIAAYEAEHAVQFAGVVLHDSEDVIHASELSLFNVHLPAKDMIQLPVASLEQRFRDLVAGTYMDEFAECHAKDLLVRQWLAGTVPSAGVGTCFSRKALEVLSECGEPFNTKTLTEDYDIGSRLAERGLQTAIELYPVEYRTRQRSFLGLGPSQDVIVRMPLCVREHFPSNFRASYRQKARWILGIALQGWSQLGWSGSARTNYFRFRDRKALITPSLAILAYAILVVYSGLALPAALSGTEVFDLMPDTPLGDALLWFNLAALVARLSQRMYFTGRIYGFGHAVCSVPRSLLLSIINFVASIRAIRIFVSSKVTGHPIAWDKTVHRFPSNEWLGHDKRRLGDILLAWKKVSSPTLDRTVMKQILEGGKLGELLIDSGHIDEEMLTEAIAVQHQLPRASLTKDLLAQHSEMFDAKVMVPLRVLPIGLSPDGKLMLATSNPLPPDDAAWVSSRVGKAISQFIVPASEIHAMLPFMIEQASRSNRASISEEAHVLVGNKHA